MIIGTLEENFIKSEGNKSTIKVKCNHSTFNSQVLPVNIVRIAGLMNDFMYKGDFIALKGRMELDNKGNIELLAERFIYSK